VGLRVTSCSHEGELRGYLTVEKFGDDWVVSARRTGRFHPEVIVTGQDLHETAEFALPYLTVCLEDHDMMKAAK
jgi:hypothetical protein